MSKKRVENYIPRAIEVLEKKFKSKAIPKEYNGYISSFGAGIIQNGLKPTVAIYENKQANNKSDKDVLTEIILQIIDSNTQENSLLRYILSSKENEDILKEKIKDAAIAIKLSIRTFKLVENKDK